MAQGFQTTRWSLVLAAGEGRTAESGRALSSLCEAYWYPLYAFVRRQGNDPEAALDLTQSYFLTLLEKNYIAEADPERGRFRSFLLQSVKNFLSKERERDRALKRGGDQRAITLDLQDAEQRYARELSETTPAEALFDRRWATTVLERALDRLAGELAKSGKEQEFRYLRPHLTGQGRAVPYAELALQLETSEGAIKVAVHRSRRRFGELLRAEITDTVASSDEVDGEVRYLLEVLRG